MICFCTKIILYKIKVSKGIVESENMSDLGVRLNMALASLSLQNGTYLLQPRSSQFNLRIVYLKKKP